LQLLTIILLAVGLSMDAFAVSVSSGLIIPNANRSHGLKIAFYFGVFQAVMPLFGWVAGHSVRNLISGSDHWIAFTLLGFIGGKMVYEALCREPEEKTLDPTHPRTLLMLSIATSIDALAIGLTFALLNTPLFPSVLIIGFTTFIISGAGVYMGKQWGKYFGRWVEMAGGLILIGIGAKILIEHILGG
jgi:manganese efflux pump family protein